MFPYIIKKVNKEDASANILNKLNSYLDSESDEPVKVVARFLSDLDNAVTYKELREAIISGQISESIVNDWQVAYSNLVNTKMRDIWESSNASGSLSVGIEDGFYFDPTRESTQRWIGDHSGEWVTRTVQAQRDAINAMIGKAYNDEWTVDELAKVIRPTIGLTRPQANANLNYYNHVKTSLLENNPTMRETTAEKRAREAALKYAECQHRQRAYTIATNEMAFAYNKGADLGVRQAQEQGYLGIMTRTWSTADDELVCPICGALDGVSIDMDDEFDFVGYSLFSGQKQTPPAHTRCRCACEYEEVSPPKFEKPSLSYEEEYAVNRYIGSTSYKINEKLRSESPLSADDYSFIANMDTALSKFPKYKGTLLRSLEFMDSESQQSFLENHKNGNIIEYGQYVSTTKRSVYNSDAAVQIIILYATQGHDISAYNTVEKEVIYDRNSRFIVKDVNESEDGTVIITMEEYI